MSKSNKIMPKSETSDLNQLRGLLFGEQAQQTDDRFEMLENSINALRRENRQLRQALEVEAMTRIEADESQGNSFTDSVDSSLNELSTILLTHVQSERTKRAQQHVAMVDALSALETSQNEVTGKLIAHLQHEQAARSQQFAALKAQLSAENGSQNEVSDALTNLLSAYAGKHGIADVIVDEAVSAESD